MDQFSPIKSLPFLSSASQAFKTAFAEKSVETLVPSGKMICMENNQCPHLPIVLEGEARVYKASDEGKEITLYRIEAGESCILTASCIVNQVNFPANAIATTDIKAIVVSPFDVRNWMHESDEVVNMICHSSTILKVKTMNLNMGTLDRIARVIIAIVVGILFFTGQISGTIAIVLGLLAIVFVLTSIIGTCPLYLPFGLSTKSKTPA